MNWLSNHWNWLFQGVGGAALVALIIWLLESRHKKSGAPPSPTTINVNPNISPNIAPTFINTVAAPAQPANRPKIVLKGWGTKAEHTAAWAAGFYLNNHGEVSLQVQVQRFQIAPGLFASSGVVSSIGQGEPGFAHVWVEGFPRADMTKWDLLGAMRKAAEDKHGHAMYRPDYTVPVKVTYRDFDNQWYESEADLSYILARGELKFGPTTQRKITPSQTN